MGDCVCQRCGLGVKEGRILCNDCRKYMAEYGMEIALDKLQAIQRELDGVMRSIRMYWVVPSKED